MSHYDNRLPFSPLTDAALVGALLSESARQNFDNAIHLADAVTQRLTGDPGAFAPSAFGVDVGSAS